MKSEEEIEIRIDAGSTRLVYIIIRYGDPDLSFNLAYTDTQYWQSRLFCYLENFPRIEDEIIK